MGKKERINKLFNDIVIRFSQESHCESKKVAAIAVKNNRIISTGINGTPKGYTNCDEYFKLLYEKRYKEDFKSYLKWKETEEWREIHHKWSLVHELHAEQNLIGEAAKNGISIKNCDIYISLEPCIDCAKLLIAAGVKRIFYSNEYDKSNEYWKFFLRENNITIIKL